MGLFDRNEKNLSDKMKKENNDVILNIKREKSFEAALVPMEIYINNNKITKLKNGQNFTTRVPSGNVSLKIKMWWMTDNKTIEILKDCKSIYVEVGLEVGLVTKKPKIKLVMEDNKVLIEKNNILNEPINDNIPQLLIIDTNKDNESVYLDTYNWFKSNKQSIIYKLKEVYIEYQDIINKNFIIFSIEGINKQEFISDKFDDNQNLYMHTPLGDFVDKYNDNASFLKIQCGSEDDDDTFSFAFINCNTKEIMYLFHRF